MLTGGRSTSRPALDKNDGNVGPAGFTVTYKATDGDLDSNPATLTISVSAVNDGTAMTNEDTAATVDFSAHVSTSRPPTPT